MTKRQRQAPPKKESDAVAEPQPIDVVRDLAPIQAMRIERNMAQRVALRHEFEARMARIEADDAALELELASGWGISVEELRSSRIEFDFATNKARIKPQG